MNQSLHRRLDALRRRERAATTLSQLSWHASIALAIGGSVVLLARATTGVEVERVAWIPALALVAPLTAWWRARRGFLSDESLATWLDLRAGATGGLVTGFELDDPRWAAQLDRRLAALPPSPAWNWRPSLGRVAAASLFALATIWIDVASPAGSVVPPAVFSPAIEELREQLAALEEEAGLDEERADELAERLDAVEEEAEDARQPEATFEAIDQLAGELEQEAEKAREEALASYAALEGAAAGAEADPEASRDALAAALEQVASFTPDGELSDALGGQLPPGTSELPEGLELGPEALRELSAAMKTLLQEQMNALAEAGLLESLDLAKLVPHPGGAAGAGEGLAKFELHVCDENCLKPGGT